MHCLTSAAQARQTGALGMRMASELDRAGLIPHSTVILLTSGLGGMLEVFLQRERNLLLAHMEYSVRSVQYVRVHDGTACTSTVQYSTVTQRSHLAGKCR